MKADQLVNLIDKLVERKLTAKVHQIIKEEVSSEINKAMGRVLVEMVKEVKKAPTSTEETHTEEKLLVSPIQTGNPKLNSVLAETARNFKPLQKTSGGASSLAELLDGGFDKIGEGENISYAESIQPNPKVESDGSNIGFLKSMISEGVTGQQYSVLGTDAVPDVLKGVFSKKAKEVFKRMEEQKKNGTMGMIDPRSILSG